MKYFLYLVLFLGCSDGHHIDTSESSCSTNPRTFIAKIQVESFNPATSKLVLKNAATLSSFCSLSEHYILTTEWKVLTPFSGPDHDGDPGDLNLSTLTFADASSDGFAGLDDIVVEMKTTDNFGAEVSASTVIEVYGAPTLSMFHADYDLEISSNGDLKALFKEHSLDGLFLDLWKADWNNDGSYDETKPSNENLEKKYINSETHKGRIGYDNSLLVGSGIGAYLYSDFSVTFP